MTTKQNYNPDVLDALANLSNDEVFTPPKLVNEVLDMLPDELWSDKNATFLDPATKSGVFLREIAKRLIKGLDKEIPNLQERLNHIYTSQLFGIGITELTSLLARRSLYCSKKANHEKYSVCTEFESEDGNIRDERIEHTWKSGKCEHCGASQSEYDRDESLETHAYEFIHKTPEEIISLFNKKNMKFDVIIGNPPYQLDTGGSGRQAKPIYQHFISQAKKLSPRYLSMIVPARWFAGGFGLNDFRQEMLGDKRMRKIVDFQSSRDIFPGVDVAGGICYFLWDRDNEGQCEIVNIFDGEKTGSVRHLDEFSTFIRNSLSVPIVRKVSSLHKGGFLDERVSPQKPFGLSTNYKAKKKGVPCWFTQRIGLCFANEADISDRNNYLDKWKLLLPKAPIAGQTDFSKPVGFYYDGNIVIAKPGECCTESWIVAGAFKTEKEVLSFKSYIFTKVARFLLLQTVVSQDVLRNKFVFVPDLGEYEGEYTDEILCKRWNISDLEWEYIDSRIK